MKKRIGRYLFYLIPSLLIIALVTSMVSFFEYDRYQSKKIYLENALNYNGIRLTQKAQSYRIDLERMFTRIQNNTIINNSVIAKSKNTDIIHKLFRNEMTVKPYIRSIGLLTADEKGYVYLSSDTGSTQQQPVEAQKKEMVKLSRVLQANPSAVTLFLPTLSYSKINEKHQKTQVISRFIGSTLYYNNKIIGTIYAEINMQYLVDQLFNLLDDNMKAMLIGINERYVASEVLDSATEELIPCEIQKDCALYFEQNMIDSNRSGENYFDNQYVSTSKIYLNNDRSSFDLLLIQYKDADLLPKQRLFYVLLHSKHVMYSILLTIFSCMMAIYQLIMREKRLARRYYAERLSQAFTVISNFIERLHEYDDSKTASHVHRITFYSEVIAKELGLKANIIEQIHLFASLHDIGKIAIPDNILKKESGLSKDEWTVMTSHVQIGYEIINEFQISPIAENIALYHHEKWDGSGYGKGLVGTAIPIEARIVAVTDCYDALTTERPYKKAFSHEKACAIINSESGTAFDPGVVKVFNRCSDQFKAYKKRLSLIKD